MSVSGTQEGSDAPPVRVPAAILLSDDNVPTEDDSSDTCSTQEASLPITQDKANTAGSLPKFWTPFYLRRPVLLSFIITFITLLVALCVTFAVSSKNGYLAPANYAFRYLWVYGPTVVFITIAAFWSQVEYRSKQMMPWVLLRRGPQSAQNSLLLDYLDAINIVSFYRALRGRHWIVFTAVSGTFLLQLMTVASSHLFTDIHMDITTRNAELMTQDAFVYSKSSSVGSKAATNVYGILASNLSFPLGTHNQYAFQLFESPKGLHGVAHDTMAFVDVFEAELDCEVGNVVDVLVRSAAKNEPNTLDKPNPSVIQVSEGKYTYMRMNTSSCSNLYLSLQSGARFGYNGSFCGNKVTGNTGRLVLAWSNEEGVGISINSAPTTSTIETGAHKSRTSSSAPYNVLVCEPKYSIRKGTVSLRHGINGVVPLSISYGNEPASTIPRFTSWNILEQIAFTISETNRVIPSLDMEAFIEATISHSNFTREATKKQDAISRLFRLTAAQVANTYLKTSSQEAITGTVISVEAMLQVTPLSFWLTVPSLAVLALLAAYLVWQSPTITAPSDPSTIGGLATLLAKSHSLLSHLRGTGHLNSNNLELRLQHHKFSTNLATSSTTCHPVFQIDCSETAEEAPLMGGSLPNDSELQDKMDWYRPFAVTIAGRFLILSSIPALILALELLYQHSEQNNGLASDENINTLAHYAWTYIPTALMVGTGLLLGTVYTAVRLFSPYQNLHRGGAPPDKSIFENHFRSVTVTTLWRSASKREYTVFSAGVASVLAPLLTIFISGLLSREPVPTGERGSVTRMDTFDQSQTGNEQGHIDANLVLASNLSDPLWTNYDLAFPQLALGHEIVGKGVITVTIPAMRAKFNCTPATREEILCTDSNVVSNYLSRLNTTHEPIQNKKFGGTGYFGLMAALEGIVDEGESDCPRVIVAFGHTTKFIIDTISHLGCSPLVEMVQVSATFRLPTWELDNTQPTVADETSARVLDGYKLPGFLSNFELSFANPLGSVPSDEDLAGPFPLVVHGRNGTPIPDLIGPENIDRLQDAVQTTYALIMAQLLNRGRMDFVGSSNETYEGTIIQGAEYRLKQSVISTRILEGLLVVMFIGVLVAFIRLRTKGVLPRPVFSIASGASLLAGSMLLRNLPEGTEQLSKKEIEEGGIFRGMAFRLGWWEDESESIVNRGNGECVSANETEGLRSRFGIDLDKDGDTE